MSDQTRHSTCQAVSQLTDNLRMHTQPSPCCYLDGEFATLPYAKVGVMNQGFILSDDVYDVVRIHKGRQFCFAPTLKEARL
ncbi:hypothetical protein [Rhodoferax sp.]|uniref:hypothetical protein n=1 Tax=Rhodoferax sp. TaxID=50421 RepID=UPI0028480466|nr:hypothetical protein [Rhodoferax sp.]MDR3367936.1 hypothetical protein [Rhodoferax sp.]